MRQARVKTREAVQHKQTNPKRSRRESKVQIHRQQVKQAVRQATGSDLQSTGLQKLDSKE